MKIKVDNGNAIIDQNVDGFRINIPSKKNIFSMLFLTVWLGGWFVGEASALAMVISGGATSFMIFWIVGWTLGGMFAVSTLLWMAFGKEVIIFDGMSLMLEKRLLGLRFKKEYDLESVKDMRVVEENTSFFSRRRGLDYYGITGGKIHFDYGMKTVNFGINIDAAEAKHLLETVFKSIRY